MPSFPDRRKASSSMNSWPIFLSLILKDPASGAAEGYLVNRHYPDRQIAERVVAWLKNRTKEDSAHCGYPISLKARIQKSAEGFFKIVAFAKLEGSHLQVLMQIQEAKIRPPGRQQKLCCHVRY